MERSVQRQIDKAALFWLVIVALCWLIALHLAWDQSQASVTLFRATRAKGFVSYFGNAATIISAIGIPLIVWLFRKAFFGKYKMGP